MADSPKSNAPLSEISHLFLTGIRERQTQGNRPTRTPPTRQAPKPQPAPQPKSVSVDLTPEEFERQMMPAVLQGALDETQTEKPSRQAIIVLAHHLGDGGPAHVRQYARHLASRVGRVGLIEVTEQSTRLICLDASSVATESDDSSPAVETREARRVAEAIEEMSWDVDRWLIYPGDGPRTTHGRNLLAAARNCTLLSTADHDGVIACYRTLKGLSDLERPAISLAVINAKTADEADGVYRKLSGVSQQFLSLHLESEGQVLAVQGVAEHLVMTAHIEGPAAGAIWSTLMPWVSDGSVPLPVAEEPEPVVVAPTAPPVAASAPVVPNIKSEKVPAPIGEKPMSEPVSSPAPAISEPTRTDAPLKMDLTEVMDLPGPDASVDAILSAVTQQAAQWIQCPIHPPMCPNAKVCVGRDGRLLLLAVAGRGLRELRAIGLAFRWAAENRPLIKMALPQLSIDAMAIPALKLYVDHADLSADILDPLLQSSHVTVQAYRKLRWGQRTGLMLEAA